MCCLAGCSPPETEFATFNTYESPDGKTSITIKTAHGNLAYAPQLVHIYSPDRKEPIARTKIANDGASINKSNVKASWPNNFTLKLCLSGVEQNDNVLVINTKNYSYSEEKKSCNE